MNLHPMQTSHTPESLQVTAADYLCAKAGCQLEFSGNDAVMYYLGQLCIEKEVPEEAFDELITSTATQGAQGRARDVAHAQACRINNEGFQTQMRFLFETRGVVAAHDLVKDVIDDHEHAPVQRQRAA